MNTTVREIERRFDARAPLGYYKDMHFKHIPLILAGIAAVTFIVGYVLISRQLGTVKETQTMMGKSVVTPIIPRVSETASAAQ